MKKYILLVLCFCILCCGCSKPIPLPASVPPIVSAETVTENTKAPDGNLLLERSYPRFTLSFPDDRVAQGISEDLQNRINLWMSPSADFVSFAQSEYSCASSWAAWYAKLESRIMRLDDTVFSLYFEYSEFTGSNHPTLSTYSVTYDSKTGKILELSNLMLSGISITTLAVFVNDALEHRSNELYDDYEALIGKAFSDEAVKWYLSDEGLCFHFAPYAIASYATGPVIATIPYTQLSHLIKPQYLPI